MNRPSTTAARIATIAVSALLLAGCGSASTAPGDATGGAAGSAGASSAGGGDAGAIPGSAATPAPRRLRTAIAQGKAHHRRPSRSARQF